MTVRLTRWLNTLDNFEARIAQLPAVRRYGRLTRDRPGAGSHRSAATARRNLHY